MPTKEELIKQCRYYKGEEESPYEGVDQDKDMLWFYESHWVMSGTSEDMVSDYHRLHISTDNISIPTSLKALLFNRFAKKLRLHSLVFLLDITVEALALRS